MKKESNPSPSDISKRPTPPPAPPKKTQTKECGKLNAKTLREFYRKHRAGHNPITGAPNLYKDISDEMIWDTAFKAGSNRDEIKEAIALLSYTEGSDIGSINNISNVVDILEEIIGE